MSAGSSVIACSLTWNFYVYSRETEPYDVCGRCDKKLTADTLSGLGQSSIQEKGVRSCVEVLVARMAQVPFCPTQPALVCVC